MMNLFGWQVGFTFLFVGMVAGAGWAAPQENGKLGISEESELPGVQKLERPLLGFLPRGEKVEISTFLEIPSLEFLLSVDEGRSDLAASQKRIQYVPSATSMIGARVGYAGLSWSIKGNLFKEDSDHVDKYGSAQFTDTEIEYFWSYFGARVFYQSYNGFYADLSASNGLTVGGGKTGRAHGSTKQEKIVKRSDIESTNYGASLLYDLPVLDYKRKDALAEIDGLKMIGFHLLADATVHTVSFSGGRSFIPQTHAKNFEQTETLREVSYGAIEARLGLFVNWYLFDSSAIFLGYKAGSGLQRQTSIYANGSESEWATPEISNWTMGYRLSGEVHQFEASLDHSLWSTEFKGTNFDASAYRYKLVYGVKL